MEERQKNFIESVVARQTEANRPVLEAVLKAYVMNEGILDKAKAAGRKVADRVKKAATADPAQFPKEKTPDVKNYAALRRAMMFEPDCWDRDYRKFEENCEMVKYFISSYGIREFNTIVGSEQFRSAIQDGRHLDKMRVNPLAREDARRRTMHECIQMLNWGDNRVLMEGILMDFDRSESASVELPPVFESREDNLGTFRECMAGIANFIRRHGYYPWGKFLQENRLLLSRAHRFDLSTPYPEMEDEVPSAKLAADIRGAYTAGTSED